MVVGDRATPHYTVFGMQEYTGRGTQSQDRGRAGWATSWSPERPQAEAVDLPCLSSGDRHETHDRLALRTARTTAQDARNLGTSNSLTWKDLNGAQDRNRSSDTVIFSHVSRDPGGTI